MQTRLGWHGRLAVALGVTASLAVAAPALAASPTVRLAGGTTTLHVASGASKALRSAGVDVRVTKPAKKTGQTLVLPIRSGSIDPATGRGTIVHKGGVTFAKGPIQVPLSKLTIDTRRRTFSATSHGTTLALATISGGKVQRRGFSTRVTGVQFKATRVGALALDTTFRTRFFRAGTLLATATIAPTAHQVALRGGSAKLTLSQTALGALAQVRAPITAVPPGKLDAATGTITLGVSSGMLDTRTFDGTINYSGGFTVANIPLTDYVAKLGKQSTLQAMGLTVATVKYSAKNVTVNPAKRMVTIHDAAVLLSPQAAGAFNGALFGGMQVLPAGAPLGTAQLTAVAR